MQATQRNWAGNYTYSSTRLHSPTTVEQIQQIVARSNKLKTLGTRHSFNAIADSSGDLITLSQLDRVLAIDPIARTVTVEGGIKYGQLGPSLHQAGFALHNMASLPHVTIAGAVATATHGSGVTNANLATSVAGMEIVVAGGERVTLSRQQHGDQFLGAVVSLGGLGVISKLTLDIVPTFAIQQSVYEQLPIAQLEQAFDAIVASAYSVSLFTDWQSEYINQVWLKRHVDPAVVTAPAPVFYDATLAPVKLHPISSTSAEAVTGQMGSVGPAYERLPHFRMEDTPSVGAELQSEYFVPRQHAVAAIAAVAALRKQLAPCLLVSEIRTIATDQLWMSPCYQQDCVGFHFTWKLDWPAVQQVLPVLEAQLAPFGARPHWGKLFTMAPAQLQSLYTRLPDFQQLLQAYDPQGVFRNAFLETNLF